MRGPSMTDDTMRIYGGKARGVGKIRKMSKLEYIWLIAVDGTERDEDAARFQIRATYSRLTQKVRIFVDDDLVYDEVIFVGEPKDLSIPIDLTTEAKPCKGVVRYSATKDSLEFIKDPGVTSISSSFMSSDEEDGVWKGEAMGSDRLFQGMKKMAEERDRKKKMAENREEIEKMAENRERIKKDVLTQVVGAFTSYSKKGRSSLKSHVSSTRDGGNEEYGSSCSSYSSKAPPHLVDVATVEKLNPWNTYCTSQRRLSQKSSYSCGDMDKLQRDKDFDTRSEGKKPGGWQMIRRVTAAAVVSSFKPKSSLQASPSSSTTAAAVVSSFKPSSSLQASPSNSTTAAAAAAVSRFKPSSSLQASPSSSTTAAAAAVVSSFKPSSSLQASPSSSTKRGSRGAVPTPLLSGVSEDQDGSRVTAEPRVGSSISGLSEAENGRRKNSDLYPLPSGYSPDISYISSKCDDSNRTQNPTTTTSAPPTGSLEYECWDNVIIGEKQIASKVNVKKKTEPIGKRLATTKWLHTWEFWILPDENDAFDAAQRQEVIVELTFSKVTHKVRVSVIIGHERKDISDSLLCVNWSGVRFKLVDGSLITKTEDYPFSVWIRYDTEQSTFVAEYNHASQIVLRSSNMKSDPDSPTPAPTKSDRSCRRLLSMSRVALLDVVCWRPWTFNPNIEEDY